MKRVAARRSRSRPWSSPVAPRSPIPPAAAWPSDRASARPRRRRPAHGEGGGPAKATGDLAWHTVDPEAPIADSLASFVKDAKAAGLKPYAYLHATWCGPCNAIEKTHAADAQMVDAFKGTAIAMIDIDAADPKALSRRASRAARSRCSSSSTTAASRPATRSTAARGATTSPRTWRRRSRRSSPSIQPSGPRQPSAQRQSRATAQRRAVAALAQPHARRVREQLGDRGEPDQRRAVDAHEAVRGVALLERGDRVVDDVAVVGRDRVGQLVLGLEVA